mmetsp:Transcript_6636/g.12506  ORF Transcript_6636/g.12506 Transcript_6636/m.12506 type:complete len:211 (+) Transcript_6636:855-1487(+)
MAVPPPCLLQLAVQSCSLLGSLVADLLSLLRSLRVVILRAISGCDKMEDCTVALLDLFLVLGEIDGPEHVPPLLPRAVRPPILQAPVAKNNGLSAFEFRVALGEAEDTVLVVPLRGADGFLVEEGFSWVEVDPIVVQKRCRFRNRYDKVSSILQEVLDARDRGRFPGARTPGEHQLPRLRLLVLLLALRGGHGLAAHELWPKLRPGFLSD